MSTLNTPDDYAILIGWYRKMLSNPSYKQYEQLLTDKINQAKNQMTNKFVPTFSANNTEALLQDLKLTDKRKASLIQLLQSPAKWSQLSSADKAVVKAIMQKNPVDVVYKAINNELIKNVLLESRNNQSLQKEIPNSYFVQYRQLAEVDWTLNPGLRDDDPLNPAFGDDVPTGAPTKKPTIYKALNQISNTFVQVKHSDVSTILSYEGTQVPLNMDNEDDFELFKNLEALATNKKYNWQGKFIDLIRDRVEPKKKKTAKKGFGIRQVLYFKNPQEIRERVNVLIGSKVAGNSSVQSDREAKALLYELVKLNEIKARRRLLTSLKNIFNYP